MRRLEPPHGSQHHHVSSGLSGDVHISSVPGEDVIRATSEDGVFAGRKESWSAAPGTEEEVTAPGDQDKERRSGILAGTGEGGQEEEASK